ncbi:40S ribosomal protein S19, partial [Pyrobaculum aerophilum]|uniref:40S ribosomal protein S19 n=1 Tax=Pyrobaculum aerophilum TaxID=13773 RepID=UPI0015F25C79
LLISLSGCYKGVPRRLFACSAYGYRAKIGDKMRPERTRKAGGAIIRKILQQLEQAGYVAKTKQGRVLTPEGRSLVDRIATKIAKELVKSRPELVKYLAPPKE